MVGWLGPVVLNKAIQRPFRRNRIRHWRIGVREGKTPLFSDPQSGFEGVRWIESPKAHFWADPFLLQLDGKTWAFFGEYCYTSKRGRISCAEISAEGNFLAPVACLQDAKHHFSYPFVLHAGDDLFRFLRRWIPAPSSSIPANDSRMFGNLMSLCFPAAMSIPPSGMRTLVDACHKRRSGPASQ